MNPAKAITRVPVPDLCCLWAETPAAPVNIALMGISGGATPTGPGGQVQLAAICSFIAARLGRAPVLRRLLLPAGPDGLADRVVRRWRVRPLGSRRGSALPVTAGVLRAVPGWSLRGAIGAQGIQRPGAPGPRSCRWQTP